MKLRATIVAILAAVTILAAGIGEVRSQGSVIREIRVEGNNRIEADTVLSRMLLAPGDRYDAGRADRSLKALFDSGLFADVLFRLQGDVLVVSVLENPVINRIAFEGNKRIPDETMTQEVSLRPREVYTRAKIQAGANRIIQLYRRSGRFAATVEPKIINLEQNRVDVAFEINEGPLTGVGKIDFIGNRAFDDGDLHDVIVTKETAWYRFLSSADSYDPDRLTLDRDQLRRHYRDEGYADFRVLSSVAELTADRAAFFITFSVDEGEPYNFGEISLTTTLKNLDVEQLRGELTTVQGERFNASGIEDSRVAIADALGRLGYAFVEVRPRIERNREDLTISVLYEVREGPRVYVERIDITGNVRTLDKVIRREFRFAEGDAFNTSKYRRTRQRVRGLGFFDRVELTRQPGSQPDRVIVNLDVQERSTGELSFGAGFSSAEALIGDVSIRERNLLGRGQDLRISVAASFRRQQIDLSFTEPYFLDRELAAGFDVFHTRRDLQDRSSFDQRLTGGRLRTAFDVTEQLRASLNYGLRIDDINDVNLDASPFIQAEAGESVTSSIGYTLTYDTTNDRFLPTRGYRISGGQEFAGLGGDTFYIQTTGKASYFYPFTDVWVLGFYGDAGHIMGIDDDVSIINRFFVGGDNFRGFASGGIGPRDVAADDALGGNLFAIGTAELRVPIDVFRDLGVSGRIFSDVGTLYDIDVAGTGLRDSSSLRMSVGVGISWRSPFGPIRMDFAQALLKESFDHDEVFRFSFGTRF